jgi:hypothetical protein
MFVILQSKIKFAFERRKIGPLKKRETGFPGPGSRRNFSLFAFIIRQILTKNNRIHDFFYLVIPGWEFSLFAGSSFA